MLVHSRQQSEFGLSQYLIPPLPRYAFVLVALSACTTMPPVQEMSDARQAIGAAEAVNAAQHAPEPLDTAQDLMRKAQSSLESGAYDEARQLARDARQQAIQAREVAARPRSIPQEKP